MQRISNARIRAFQSECGAYVEADVGIDQRLLCCGDAIDGQWCLEWRTTLDQTEGYGAELEMACRTANETDAAPIKLQLRPRSWKRIDAAVQVQQYQPARRSSKVVDPGNRLLTPVTAFVQMDGNAEQTDLVRDGAVVGVEADPRHTGSDPTGLQRPGASSRPAAHDVFEPITRHEELSAIQRVGANSDEVIARQLSSGPHDRVISAPVSTSTRIKKRIPSSQLTSAGAAPGSVCAQKVSPSSTPYSTCSMWPCGDSTKRRYATARLQPFEVLRCQRVQPRQPVGPGHADHTTVGQVNDAFAAGEQPLLTHWVAVVPRHTDIWPSLGYYSGHGRFSTPVHIFLPVRLPS